MESNGCQSGPVGAGRSGFFRGEGLRQQPRPKHGKTAEGQETQEDHGLSGKVSARGTPVHVGDTYLFGEACVHRTHLCGRDLSMWGMMSTWEKPVCVGDACLCRRGLSVWGTLVHSCHRKKGTQHCFAWHGMPERPLQKPGVHIAKGLKSWGL